MTLNHASKTSMLLEKLSDGHAHTGHPITEPVQIHSALEEVRKMREFQPAEPDPVSQWLEQPFFKELLHRFDAAFNRMTDALSQFLHWMHLPGVAHLPENIRELFSGFVAVMAILTGLFALYVLLGIFLRWTEEKRTTTKPIRRFFEDTLLINAAHHQQQARLCASQGRFSESIRQWYLAMLCLLDEYRLVPVASTQQPGVSRPTGPKRDSGLLCSHLLSI
jgi:hypothetical protein